MSRMTTASRASTARQFAPTSPPLPRRWSITPSDLNWGVLGIGLIISAMWVRHGGLDLFDSPLNALVAIGQLTALFGTYLALVGILLMSRAPFIDQVLGSDEASRLHRLAGFTSVWLIGVHAVASTVGFSGVTTVPTLGEIWEQIYTFTILEEGGLGATVALALLILVALVSIRAARARLAYETWYGIHLYVYIAMALGFLHQLAIGTDFVGDELARNSWIALYAVAFVPLIIFRFLEPLFRNLRHRFYIDKVVIERDGVASIWIAGNAMDKLPVRAGQWFGIRVLNARGWWKSNPFSLSSGPNGIHLRFTVEALGDRSREFQNLEPGTRVFLEGPYGILTGAVRTREKVLLIAGGIGITPLRALFEVLPVRRGDMALLYRAPSNALVVLKRELRRIAEARGARLDIVTGSRDQFTFNDDPLSPGGLWAAYPDIRERDIYLCGSPRMMATVEKSLRDIGVSKGQIHLERFSW
jgi:predicted ferric reductase